MDYPNLKVSKSGIILPCCTNTSHTSSVNLAGVLTVLPDLVTLMSGENETHLLDGTPLEVLGGCFNVDLSGVV